MASKMNAPHPDNVSVQINAANPAHHYKLFVTDIDGTLVDKKQQISPENLAAVHAFQAQGGLVTLATGRIEQAAMRYARELNINSPVILYNGAKVVDLQAGETLYEAVLPREIVARAVALQKQHDLTMILYANKQIYVQTLNDTVLKYANKDGVTYGVIELADLIEQNVNKILTIRENGDFSIIRDAFAPDDGTLCELVQTESTYYEILPPHISKGTGLMHLAKILGIDLSEIIAIGDHMNDLHMLEVAGLGVAVANAHPDVLAIANLIAPSNLEHGVAHTITHYALRHYE
jgi:Cof subfamily protein (haloacid dehalogenase superfamily)